MLSQLYSPVILGLLVSWIFSILPIVGVTRFVRWSARRHAGAAGDKPHDALAESRLHAEISAASHLVTAVALFYLALSLASRAFSKTGSELPVLGDTYRPLPGDWGPLEDVWTTVHVQDVILLSFVAMSVVLAYGVLPTWPRLLTVTPVRTAARFWIFLVSLAAGIALAAWLAASLGTAVEPPAHLTTDDVRLAQPPLREIALAGALALVGFIVGTVSQYRLDLDEDQRGDLQDLRAHLGFLPALIVGPMVVSSDKLILFPNLVGNALAGLLVINGLLVLLIIANMASEEGPGIEITLCSSAYSLGYIFASALTALLVRRLVPDINANLLLLPPAVLLILLPYANLFPRIWRAEFSHWWLIERTSMMQFGIVLIFVVGPIPNDNALLKLIGVVVAVVILFVLPFVRAAELPPLKELLAWLRVDHAFVVSCRSSWRPCSGGMFGC